MKNILITGSDGYIATALIKALGDRNNIFTTSHKDRDLTDPDQVESLFYSRYYDVVIHTACVGGSRLKKEDYTITRDNVAMYYNFAAMSDHFTKFISFGSGAEIDHETSYGLGKRIIADDMLKRKGFYNIRVFAVFDENELPTRFIKANIMRYINYEPMRIHKNRYMEFFYMKDLIKLVELYIETNDMPNVIEASYEETFNLFDIASMINKLGDYQTPIIIENIKNDKSYVGYNAILPIQHIGLKQGIKEVYEILRKTKL